MILITIHFMCLSFLPSERIYGIPRHYDFYWTDHLIDQSDIPESLYTISQLIKDNYWALSTLESLQSMEDSGE